MYESVVLGWSKFEFDDAPCVSLGAYLWRTGGHVAAVSASGSGAAVPCDLYGTWLSATGWCEGVYGDEHVAVLESAVSDASGPCCACDAVLGEGATSVSDGCSSLCVRVELCWFVLRTPEHAHSVWLDLTTEDALAHKVWSWTGECSVCKTSCSWFEYDTDVATLTLDISCMVVTLSVNTSGALHCEGPAKNCHTGWIPTTLG